ncbi:hypothetical protein BMG00_13100 [Thioclava marina]|uniref:Glycosyltransferase 2-like domain-containing protein n=1 Tax=Thioclava marina TaxID=1915077 RepID=A0ABX3MPK1_9RHOB|nr:glycosyltransferase [Thioclava marina]OOY12003.1 hypothetical protein BMG00_13100 [Thioclava marina]
MFSIVTATMKLAPEELAPILATYDAFAAKGLAFELIVQDNCSGEAVLAELRQRPYVKLVSATDTGIYDAWNQALPRVSGDWVGFLGIDDLPSLEWVAFASSHIPPNEPSVLACDVSLEDASHTRVGVFRNPRVGTLNTRANAFAHPGLAVASSIFQNRRFPEQYRIIGDLVFYAQFRQLPVAGHLGAVGVSMRLGGISNSPIGARRVLREYLNAVSNGDIQPYFPLIAKRLIAAALSLLPALYVRAQRRRWRTFGE